MLMFTGIYRRDRDKALWIKRRFPGITVGQARRIEPGGMRAQKNFEAIERLNERTQAYHRKACLELLSGNIVKAVWYAKMGRATDRGRETLTKLSLKQNRAARVK